MSIWFGMRRRSPVAAPTRAAEAEGRVERRRLDRHRQLVSIAARSFAAHGVEAVRLDAIADAADIARGTLYSHFPSKQALIAAIVRPVLERAVGELERIEPDGGVAAVDRLLSVWVALWSDHRDAMRVVERVRAMSLGELSELHATLMRRLYAIFAAAGRRGLLRSEDPEAASRILARVAVPMLEACGDEPEGVERFRDAMRAMLLRPTHRPRVRPRDRGG